MTTRVGVIADTHVPQRRACLPDGIADSFAGVELILHAGDINLPRVLDELSRIAPVVAVAGNADPPWLDLPYSRMVQVDGCRIGLTHGHGGWKRYLKNKLTERWRRVRYLSYLRYARETFTDVDVIVTGHTHRPHLIYDGNTLLFNPGSAGPDYYLPALRPTVGLLHIRDGLAQAELIPLQPFGI